MCQVQAWRTRRKSRLSSLRRRVQERKMALVTESRRSKERLALVASSFQSIQVSRTSIRDAEVSKVNEPLCLRVSTCALCAVCPTDEDIGKSVSLLPHVWKCHAVMFSISTLAFLASVFRHQVSVVHASLSALGLLNSFPVQKRFYMINKLSFVGSSINC